MSFFKVFMLILFYPILPIMYFVLINEAKPRKNIILGVTLPRLALNDSDLIDICNQFKYALRKFVLLLAIPPFSLFCVSRSSTMMLILMYWLIFAIIVPFVPYTRYHRKLKALKQSKNWKVGTTQKILVDIKAAAEVENQTNAWLFIPAIIISAYPVVYELTAGREQTHISIFLGCCIMLFTTVLFYIFYRLASQLRTEIIDEDSKYNIALTRVRRYNWARFWIWAAWLNTFYSIIFWLGINGRTSFTVFMLSTIIYAAAMLWAVLKAEFTTRSMQHKLAAESTKPIYMDEVSNCNNSFIRNSYNRYSSNRIY